MAGFPSWLSAFGGIHISPDDVGGSHPTTFGLATGGLGFYRGLGKVKLNLDYDFRQFDYDATPSARGDLDQSTRNRDEHIMGAKVAYDVSPNVKPYVRGGVQYQNVRKEPDT